MRVLVIGGTGFIGPYVVRRLVEQGHEVVVFHRGRTQAALPPEVTHILDDQATAPQFNRQRLPEFAADFQRFAPDVALGMSLMTEADARVVTATLRGQAGRVVGISSIDVYRAYVRSRGTEPGPPDPLPLTEASPLREKLYPYRGPTPRPAADPDRWIDEYDKIPVEQVLMADPDLPGTILRLPMVYGPGAHRAYEYLRRMADGRPAILLSAGAARWRGVRGYVENIAAAIGLAVTDDRAAGRIYNVAEVDHPPEAEWVRRLGVIMGWQGEIVVLPNDHLPTHLQQDFNTDQHWVADSSPIRQELDYAEHIPYDEGLRRTVAWELANPPERIDPAQFDYAAEDAALARARGGTAALVPNLV
jgi:nucleoside-diphosphate-sugar epimerase